MLARTPTSDSASLSFTTARFGSHLLGDSHGPRGPSPGRTRAVPFYDCASRAHSFIIRAAVAAGEHEQHLLYGLLFEVVNGNRFRRRSPAQRALSVFLLR